MPAWARCSIASPGVFEAILEGLGDQDINLIASVGRDRDRAAFGPQPPNIRIEGYIPHSLLLPHCDAVITHGGFGSVMACIEQGLPMVAVPLAGGDQPGNAARLVALGIARVIGPDQRTPPAIREAVFGVLQDRSYRQNAQRLKQGLQSLPALEHAVDLLQRLAHDKVPINATPKEQATESV
jgi:MGT family glycosyltransferase